MEEGSRRDATLLTEPDDNSSSPHAREVLRDTLSIKSAVSILSSFAEQMNDARSSEGQQFICIGRGSCGTIWEKPGTEAVFKTSPHQLALWVDFHLTNIVYNSFIHFQQLMESSFPGITVPRVPKASHFFTPSNEWWSVAHKKFPSDDIPKPDSTAIQLRRIHPLPSRACKALIRLYFDPACHDRALADPENKDCLVRLYFGANREDTDMWRTSLRNFELYLDMAQYLDLDVELITKEMAVSLALIHWAAKCDGMDAEWVLGSAASEEVLAECDRNFLKNKPTDIEPDFKSRTTYLWILDFDKARPIEYDNSCIPLLLGGVTANDPYLPNPRHSPKLLYQLLAKIYLEASLIILQREDPREEVLALPRQFLDAWEEWANEPEDIGFELEGWGRGDEEDDDEDEDDDDEDDDEDEDEDDEVTRV